MLIYILNSGYDQRALRFNCTGPFSDSEQLSGSRKPNDWNGSSLKCIDSLYTIEEFPVPVDNSALWIGKTENVCIHDPWE